MNYGDKRRVFEGVGRGSRRGSFRKAAGEFALTGKIVPRAIDILPQG
jgi:hypothetical protein